MYFTFCRCCGCPFFIYVLWLFRVRPLSATFHEQIKRHKVHSHHHYNILCHQKCHHRFNSLLPLSLSLLIFYNNMHLFQFKWFVTNFSFVCNESKEMVLSIQRVSIVFFKVKMHKIWFQFGFSLSNWKLNGFMPRNCIVRCI